MKWDGKWEMGIGVADGSGRAHGPREREERKGGPEEPNKAYVGRPYVWTEGYLRWTRRAEAWEEDGTINDAIPQSLLARYGSPYREREITGLTGTKYNDCLFFLLPKKAWGLEMRRCLTVFTLTRRGGGAGRGAFS